MDNHSVSCLCFIDFISRPHVPVKTTLRSRGGTPLGRLISVTGLRSVFALNAGMCFKPLWIFTSVVRLLKAGQASVLQPAFLAVNDRWCLAPSSSPELAKPRSVKQTLPLSAADRKLNAFVDFPMLCSILEKALSKFHLFIPVASCYRRNHGNICIITFLRYGSKGDCAVVGVQRDER